MEKPLGTWKSLWLLFLRAKAAAPEAQPPPGHPPSGVGPGPERSSWRW